MAKTVTIKGDYKSFMNNLILLGSEFWYITEGETKPTIECPNCGSGILGDNAPHEICENGDVNASVVCQEDDCNFHRMIRLEGWGGGYLKHG